MPPDARGYQLLRSLDRRPLRTALSTIHRSRLLVAPVTTQLSGFGAGSVRIARTHRSRPAVLKRPLFGLLPRRGALVLLSDRDAWLALSARAAGCGTGKRQRPHQRIALTLKPCTMLSMSCMVLNFFGELLSWQHAIDSCGFPPSS